MIGRLVVLMLVLGVCATAKAWTTGGGGAASLSASSDAAAPTPLR